MIINILDLVINKKNEILINEDVTIEENLLKNTSIKKLNNCIFDGKIEKITDNDYNLSGNLSGIMILLDDVTLEEIEYRFSTEIEEDFNEFTEKNEESLKIIQNTIDILPILWQNIIVEIPLKITSHEDVELKGDGWRLISEEDYEKEKSQNSPFSNLSELLNDRKE